MVEPPGDERRVLVVVLQSGGPVRYAAAAGGPLAAPFVARETGPGDPPKPRLLDRVRYYSRRTEKAYVDWIKRYIFFHNKADRRIGAGWPRVSVPEGWRVRSARWTSQDGTANARLPLENFFVMYSPAKAEITA